MQKQCRRVLTTVDEALIVLKEITFDSADMLATADISNLYPSINQDHLLYVRCARIRVRSFYFDNVPRAKLACEALRLLLSNQYVIHEGVYW